MPPLKTNETFAHNVKMNADFIYIYIFFTMERINLSVLLNLRIVISVKVFKNVLLVLILYEKCQLCVSFWRQNRCAQGRAQSSRKFFSTKPIEMNGQLLNSNEACDKMLQCEMLCSGLQSSVPSSKIVRSLVLPHRNSFLPSTD